MDRVRIGFGFRIGFRYGIPNIQIQIQTRSGLKIKSKSKSKSKIPGSVKSIRVETVGYPFGSVFSAIPSATADDFGLKIQNVTSTYLLDNNLLSFFNIFKCQNDFLSKKKSVKTICRKICLFYNICFISIKIQI